MWGVSGTQAAQAGLHGFPDLERISVHAGGQSGSIHTILVALH